ncbi:MAG: recombinase family protein [Rhodopila sp.]|jgi:DNA invertase Pin-like site-specific DNA recombinase
MIQRVFIYVRQTGTQPELVHSLQQTVANRGGNVVSVHTDDAAITGRGKYAGWRNMVADLGAVDQVVLSNAGDLPGKTVADLFKVLAILRNHGVGLYLHAERIDTASTTFAVLDIVAGYRAAKLSEAIRAGQMRARAAGRTIGRPIVPHGVQERVRIALADGGGIRPTARRFNVSPASVINIRRSMTVNQHASYPESNSRDCGDNLVA